MAESSGHDRASLPSASAVELIERLLGDFEEVRQPEDAEGPAGNIFRLLKISGDEVRHSSFLAWLFDPRGNHRQGDRFLRAFMEAIIVPPPVDLTECRVRTEFAAGRSRVDMILYRVGAFLVFIENKVFSGERDRQVDDEFEDMSDWGVALRVPPERRYAIFLSPEGRPPSSGRPGRWKTLSYEQLAERLETCLEGLPPKVETLVRDWIDCARSLRGGSS